ncbi:hypothetical protein N665_0377s0062 [Sinapis alba]|nr:hypothetical protein N665_0377s0062 [Sinapis alba]
MEPLTKTDVVDGASPRLIHCISPSISRSPVEMIKKITKSFILPKNIGSQQDFQLAPTVSRHI